MINVWVVVSSCLTVTVSYRGGSRGRVQGVRTAPPNLTCSFLIQLQKNCCIVWYVFTAVHIMLLPNQKPSFVVFALKICLRHQSVSPFLSGANSPKKNPGSTPETWERIHVPHLFKVHWLHSFIQTFDDTIHVLGNLGRVCLKLQ